MTYDFNPDLPFLPAVAGDWRGNPIEGGEFQYVRDPFRPDWSVLLRMLLSRNPQRAEKKADDWTPPVSTDVTYLEDRSRDWMVWLGHACFLFQLGGLRYLTDPQLGDMPFVPRRVHPPFPVGDIRGVDYLLLSHDHRDHVDGHCLKTLVANNDVRKIYAPLRLSRTIGSWVGNIPVEEAGWYQTFGTEGQAIELHFLPARHWCRRGLTDFNRSLWGSFMIRSLPSGRLLYFGGDSAETDYWADIGALFPDIDVAMLGIGAYAPAFMMQDNHANPEEAFRGFRDLGARHWWPMHHGTYDLSNEPASEPLRRAREVMEEAGMADRLIGQTINLPYYLDT